MKSKKRRALVCGASQGIGEAVVRGLADDGFEVTCLSRSLDKLEILAASITGVSEPIAVDLKDGTGLVAGVKANIDKYGPFAVLINNAGGPPGGSLVDARVGEFEQALATHLFASHRLVNLVLPSMKESGWGRIINIISTSVRIPIPGLGVSNTVRGAMASWAKTLANEVAPHGITVNNVLPGYTETERLLSLLQHRAKAAGVSEAEMRAQMVAEVPTGRFGRPEEVAGLVRFLAGVETGAAYITGTSIPVDGGRTGSI